MWPLVLGCPDAWRNRSILPPTAGFQCQRQRSRPRTSLSYHRVCQSKYFILCRPENRHRREHHDLLHVACSVVVVWCTSRRSHENLPRQVCATWNHRAGSMQVFSCELPLTLNKLRFQARLRNIQCSRFLFLQHRQLTVFDLTYKLETKQTSIQFRVLLRFCNRCKYSPPSHLHQACLFANDCSNEGFCWVTWRRQ